MTNLTVQELLDMGKTASTYFEKQLGYDYAHFDRVTLRPVDEHKLEFTLTDEFQSALDYDMKYKVGAYITVSVD